MFFEVIVAVVLGIVCGVITGLTPGLHINLVAALLASSASFLLALVSPFAVLAFIIAMAVTHTFLDALPSIYLGAPNPEEVVSVLPGHKLLLEGKGHSAVLLTLIGSLLALLLAVVLFPVSIYFLQSSYPLIKKEIGIILLVLAALLIWKERGSRVVALAIFLSSGLLGFLSLNSGVREPLLPLLSGLFGVSTLFLSMHEKNPVPEQSLDLQIHSCSKLKSTLFAFVGGLFGSFLPGVGASQIAIAGSDFMRDMKEEEHLIISGGLNAAGIVMSVATFFAIGKARNGAILAMTSFVKELSWLGVLFILGIAVFSAGVATLLGIRFSKGFCKVLKVVNYQKLCMGVILFIIGLVAFFSRIPGLFILFVSASLGVYTHLSGVRKSHLMGCLMIPVMVYFLF